MTRRSLGWVVAVTGAFLSTWLTPIVASAQTPGTAVGIVAGRVVNEHVWQPSATESDRVSGFVVGGFVLAPTPASWFSVLAEGTLTQRGGDVGRDIPGYEVFGVRTDYLTISVHPRVSFDAGPVAVFLNAGPSIDQVLRTRKSSGLGPDVQEVSTIFGVGAGIGASAPVSGDIFVEVEARVFEGLGDAYSGPFISFRNRSFGLVARVGRPLRR